MTDTRRGASADEGYAMAALLVAMAVMAIAMSVALPVWHTMAQREKETELIFRGQQYARALALFQRRFPGATPPNLDVLIDGRMLRKKYKDPITNDDFQIVGPGDALALQAPQGPQGAAAPGAATVAGRAAGAATPPLTAPPQSGRFGLGAAGAQRGATPSPFSGGAGAFGGVGGAFGGSVSGPGAAGGGIVGVVSKSKETSLRLYNGRNHYNEWVFMATQQTLRAGGPGGAPGGARGGNQPGVPGRGATPQGPGRATPFGGRGGFGLPPGGSPMTPQNPVR